MSRERTTTLGEDYIERLFAQESADFEPIKDALKEDKKFGINVGAYEGKLLHFLIQLTGAKKVVEIGTLYGYSTLWIAKALPKGGQVVSLEKSAKHHEAAKALLYKTDQADKIDLRQGEALSLLPKIEFTPDIVFVDADKANYFNYLQWAMESVKPGGLIIGDNTFLFGHMIGEDRDERTSPKAIEAMTQFNETLAKSDRFESIMIPSYEGMTLGMKKFD